MDEFCHKQIITVNIFLECMILFSLACNVVKNIFIYCIIKFKTSTNTTTFGMFIVLNLERHSKSLFHK